MNYPVMSRFRQVLTAPSLITHLLVSKHCYPVHRKWACDVKPCTYFVIAGSVRYGTKFTSQLVSDIIRFFVLYIDCTERKKWWFRELSSECFCWPYQDFPMFSRWPKGCQAHSSTPFFNDCDYPVIVFEKNSFGNQFWASHVRFSWTKCFLSLVETKWHLAQQK